MVIHILRKDKGKFMQVANRFKLSIILLFIFFCFQNSSYTQNTQSDKNKQNESQDETVRIETNLVTIPASVFDRNGRYITNLKKEDFQIFENGIEQEVTLFETVEQPITVFLLLDISGSMVNHLAQLKDASNVFFSQLRLDDQLMVATFDEQVRLLFNAKTVKDVRENKKLRLKINGLPSETMVYDAVEFSIKKMKKIRGRKAIILFSDGIGKGYNASASTNIEDAEENEALIYTIRFDTNPKVRFSHETEKVFRKRLESSEIANNYMQTLSQVTGGLSYQLENIADLEKTFGSVAEELRQQYNLGYYPKTEGKKGERRQIKVKVNQPNVAVRARESYVVGQKK